MYEQVLGLAPKAKLISISMNQRKPKEHLPWIANCPNALDLSMYPFRRKPGGDYLVFLGRMSPDKGAHRALAVALETGIPLKIAAKCREPLEIRYFDEFIRPHLGGSIEYVGEVGHADKVELLMGARALISPIDWEEPFGLMMIEAMACGTPVISTRRGAVPEIVEHGRTGVVVDNYRDMEDPAVLELADTLDPVVIRKEVEDALLAGDDGRELRRRVRGDHPSDRVTLRSQYDREIFRLALPALGALAAEPLYLLVDTAIVGHLGRSPARRARDRDHDPRRHVRDLQLPPVRHDRAGGSCGRRRGGGDRAAPRRAGGLAIARVRHRRLGAHRRAGSAAGLAHGRRGSGSGLRRHVPAHCGDRIPGRVPRARRAGISPWRRRPAHAPRRAHRRQRRERRPRAALRVRLRLGDRGLGVGDGSRTARDGGGVRRRRVAEARAGRSSRAARARAPRALAREVDLHPHDGVDALVRPRRCGGDALRGLGDRGAPGGVPALGLPRARPRLGRDRRSDHRRARARRRSDGRRRTARASA